MWQRSLRGLTLGLLTWAGAADPLPAQPPAAPLWAQVAGEEPEKLQKSPALPATAALVFTLLVLVILCMPSRKS